MPTQERTLSRRHQLCSEGLQIFATSIGSRWVHTWASCHGPADSEAGDPLADVLARDPQATAELCAPISRPNASLNTWGMVGASSESSRHSNVRLRNALAHGKVHLRPPHAGLHGGECQCTVRDDVVKLPEPNELEDGFDTEERKAACERAVWLLSQRLYTSKGLAEKLRARKFSEDSIEFAVSAAKVTSPSSQHLRSNGIPILGNALKLKLDHA